MASSSIGVPSVKGMKSAFGDFAVGGIGGLAYAIGQALLGSGLLGAIVAPVLAGSIVKGARGTALATTAGFLLLSGALSGGSSSAAAAPATNSRGVM